MNTSRRVLREKVPILVLLCATAIPGSSAAEEPRLASDGALVVPSSFLACARDSDCTAVATPCNSGWELVNRDHAPILSSYLAALSVDCVGFNAQRPFLGCKASKCVVKPNRGCLLRTKGGECLVKCERRDARGFCVDDTQTTDGSCP